MAKQTINIGASPNDGTGTPLRTAFDYTNQNFTELYTATGPSGNNIVVPGSATITGDLTVDTSTLKVDSANNRVGILTATPATALDVNGDITQRNGSGTIIGNIQNSSGLYDVKASANVTGLQLSTAAATPIIFALNNVEAMRLNATGLGVGAVPSVAKLELQSATDTLSLINSTNTAQGNRAALFMAARNVNGNVGNVSIEAISVNNQQNDLVFRTGSTTLNGFGTERMRIDTSGNVGIGVTPYASWPATSRALQLGASSAIEGRTNDGSRTTVYTNAVWNGTNLIYQNTAAASYYLQSSGVHSWYNAASGTAGNAITFTQAMTLDAGGRLLVGTTGILSADEKMAVKTTSNNTWAVTLASVNRGWLNRQSDAAGGIAAYFEISTSNTNVGSIVTSPSGTSYLSVSDYRLKEAVQPLVGGLARVSALKPSIYKWKSNGSSGEGFLAHELAEVVPAAVTGEKDAVNEDGTVNPQGVDMSRIVPILVAAIQELTARVQTLEAK